MFKKPSTKFDLFNNLQTGYIIYFLIYVTFDST